MVKSLAEKLYMQKAHQSNHVDNFNDTNDNINNICGQKKVKKKNQKKTNNKYKRNSKNWKLDTKTLETSGAKYIEFQLVSMAIVIKTLIIFYLKFSMEWNRRTNIVQTALANKMQKKVHAWGMHHIRLGSTQIKRK